MSVRKRQSVLVRRSSREDRFIHLAVTCSRLTGSFSLLRQFPASSESFVELSSNSSGDAHLLARKRTNHLVALPHLVRVVVKLREGAEQVQPGNGIYSDAVQYMVGVCRGLNAAESVRRLRPCESHDFLRRRRHCCFVVCVHPDHQISGGRAGMSSQAS